MNLVSLSSSASAALLGFLFVASSTTTKYGANAFTTPALQQNYQLQTTSSSSSSFSSSLSMSNFHRLNMVNLPRLDLPEIVTTKLEEYNLKNPNTMTEEEYKSYAGAAILGTLLFFAVPGALVTDLPTKLGEIVGGAVPDFALSAVVGGGGAIYLSLRKDDLGATVRDYGNQVLDTVGLPTFRYDLPSQVTDVMESKLDLVNPNTMDDTDYNGYSGAAVAGTLLFFLVPGALVTGEFDKLLDLGSSAVKDFGFSAIIGGGLAIYLSLRNDEIGNAINIAGSKVLDTIDNLIDGDTAASSTLMESSSSSESDSEQSKQESTSDDTETAV